MGRMKELTPSTFFNLAFLDLRSPIPSLCYRKDGAGDGTRTRDVRLGNVSHIRVYNTYVSLARFSDSAKSRHISNCPLEPC